jgi:hypothetical protein
MLWQKWGIRLALAGIALGAVFMAGAQWSSARYAHDLAEFERETALAIAEREKALREAYNASLKVETERREQFVAEIGLLEDRETELRRQIAEARLTALPESIVVERIVEVEGGCPLVVANPVSREFVRLWNAASRPD